MLNLNLMYGLCCRCFFLFMKHISVLACKLIILCENCYLIHFVFLVKEDVPENVLKVSILRKSTLSFKTLGDVPLRTLTSSYETNFSIFKNFTKKSLA